MFGFVFQQKLAIRLIWLKTGHQWPKFFGAFFEWACSMAAPIPRHTRLFGFLSFW
jgi:hypothetical protein